MIEALYYGRVCIANPVGSVLQVLPDRFVVDQHLGSEKIEDVYHNCR